MKLKFFIIILLFFFSRVEANNFPKPTGYCNDFSNLLTHPSKSKLENILTELYSKSSIQMIVLTVDTIAPYEPSEYAMS